MLHATRSTAAAAGWTDEAVLPPTMTCFWAARLQPAGRVGWPAAAGQDVPLFCAGCRAADGWLFLLPTACSPGLGTRQRTRRPDVDGAVLAVARHKLAAGAGGQPARHARCFTCGGRPVKATPQARRHAAQLQPPRMKCLAAEMRAARAPWLATPPSGHVPCTLAGACGDASAHLRMGPSKTGVGSASLASTTRTVSSTATTTCGAGRGRQRGAAQAAGRTHCPASCEDVPRLSGTCAGMPHVLELVRRGRWALVRAAILRRLLAADRPQSLLSRGGSSTASVAQMRPCRRPHLQRPRGGQRGRQHCQAVHARARSAARCQPRRGVSKALQPQLRHMRHTPGEVGLGLVGRGAGVQHRGMRDGAVTFGQ